MKHGKTLNRGFKKIPVQMRLSIKRKFVAFHSYKLYGVGNACHFRISWTQVFKGCHSAWPSCLFQVTPSSLLPSFKQDLCMRWQRWSQTLGFQFSFRAASVEREIVFPKGSN